MASPANRRLRSVPTTGPVRNPGPDAPGETVRADAPTAFGSSGDYLTLQFAQAADDIPAWGTSWYARDLALRRFWPTEPLFAGALFTKISQYCALDWSIAGPNKDEIEERLHGVEDGKGWEAMLLPFLTDIFTTDNGGFLEVVRTADDPLAPMITMNHLDSLRCWRTGNNQEPIIYTNLDGIQHKMKWYQIIDFTEMPSPIQTAFGRQYCVLSRLLSAAQTMRNIEQYHKEKTSGQFSKEVHFVGGIGKKQIEDVMRKQLLENEQRGMVRFSPAVIIAGLDPTARVTKETIEFAAMPDGFDLEKWIHYYFNQFALAWGADYQDFGPLPGGNLGSSHQSSVLHTKARGKGIQLFISQLQHKFNWHGIMPRTDKFVYAEQDRQADLELADVRKSRAQERQIRILSGEITPAISRELAHDEGDLTDEQLAAIKNDPNAPKTAPSAFPGGPPKTMPEGQLPSPVGGSQPPDAVRTVQKELHEDGEFYLRLPKTEVLVQVEKQDTPVLPTPVVNVAPPKVEVNVPPQQVVVAPPIVSVPPVDLSGIKEVIERGNTEMRELLATSKANTKKARRLGPGEWEVTETDG